jgi:hypothetical protein
MAAIIQSILFAAVDRTTIEMILARDNEYLPPFILNRKKVLAMMATNPVERRSEGYT